MFDTIMHILFIYFTVKTTMTLILMKLCGYTLARGALIRNEDFKKV